MERLYALVEFFAPYKFWMDFMSAISAFIAAGFWLRASLVKTPSEIPKARNLSMLDGPFGDAVTGLAKGVIAQSRLNAWAAAGCRGARTGPEAAAQSEAEGPGEDSGEAAPLRRSGTALCVEERRTEGQIDCRQPGAR